MRLGGPILETYHTPEEFVGLHRQKGYTAAYCPKDLKAGDHAAIKAYRDALRESDIVLAEVGAWSNPLSPDKQVAEQAVAHMIERLELAEELEAATCVNIVGSWHESHWYGPAAANFGQAFFDKAVEVGQKVIDAVQPKKTRMSFEIMPYSFLDGAEGYLEYLKALDRDAAAVHFDPANCIHSPRLFFDNAAFLARQFDLLKDRIVSIHLKDLFLHPDPPNVHLEEVPIGTGGLDYVSLLKVLSQLPENVPVMLEHLPDEPTYKQAAAAVRAFATQAGVRLYTQ